ncbi:hypothetical protein GCM10022226_64910 [Sphaerisporangium flaviroseum]|uniref:SH3 domain-containing protein n=1 Tax=Sphaerisporangium flaviroseum TaxID=509199 RepID=A0ABP7J4C0_9ACTN
MCVHTTKTASRPEETPARPRAGHHGASSGQRRRRLATLVLPLATASLAGSALTTATAAAHAAVADSVRADRVVTVNTETGGHINVRAKASMDSRVVGKRRDGQRVAIVCHKVGDQVSGTYGTSRFWDLLASGGYVSDAYLSTGSNAPVVPMCGRAAKEPPHRALAPRIHIGFISHR